MPVESRAGDASAHLAATSRPVILHGQRVPGAAARTAAARVFSEQLPSDVPHDGCSARHVRDAPAPQPDTRRCEAYAKLSRPRRRTPDTSKNINGTAYSREVMLTMNSSNCIINTYSKICRGHNSRRRTRLGL